MKFLISQKCAGNVMYPRLCKCSYMKCKISKAAGYVQEMYSKCHKSLILEMCKTHEISDITGNLQEISCVLVLEMYMKCEISIS